CRAVAIAMRSFEYATDARGDELAMRRRLNHFTVAVIKGPIGVVRYRHRSDDIAVRIVACAPRHCDLLHRDQVVCHRARNRAQLGAGQSASHLAIRDLQPRHPRHDRVAPGKKVARIINLIWPWHGHARPLVEQASEEALGRKLSRSMRRSAEHELAGARGDEQVLPEKAEWHRLDRNQIAKLEPSERAAQLV